MNLKTELFIDRTVVKFGVLLLNVIVRIVGKVLRIDHSLHKEPRVMAICKFKGLGSILQSTPLIQTIRANYPDVQIVYVTTESNRKLAQSIPEINTVVALNDSSFTTLIFGFFPFIYRLIRLRINHYFDLEIYSNFSSLVTTLSMATNRFGYYLRSSQYRLGIYTHMMFYNIDSPIYQTYLQLIRAFPISREVTTLKAPQFAETRVLSRFGLEENGYIIINPNASDLRLERRWDSSKFSALIQRIYREFPDMTVVLIGSADEGEYVNRLLSEVPNPNVVSTAGKTGIAELFELIQRSKMVITNDSGPMHIAFAFQKITIGLFGPCSPEQYGFHPFSIPVYKKIYCSPCVHEFDISPCHGNNQCMQLIEVDEVFGHVKTVLSGEFQPYTAESDIFYRGNDQWIPGFVVR
jgi:ADP-heptose:LPS heptosyltransferase